MQLIKIKGEIETKSRKLTFMGKKKETRAELLILRGPKTALLGQNLTYMGQTLRKNHFASLNL